MLPNASSSTRAKHQHSFLHSSVLCVVDEPPLRTEFLRVFAKDRFVELRDHGIHTDLEACRDVMIEELQTTVRHVPRHRHAKRREKAQRLLDDGHEVGELGGLFVLYGTGQSAVQEGIVDLLG